MDTNGWQQRGINPTSLERDMGWDHSPRWPLSDNSCGTGGQYVPASHSCGPPDTIGILASLYTVKLGCY